MGRMDPDMTFALTMGAIALEMRERFDVIEAAAVFEAQQRWPHGEFMPVKRTTQLVTAVEDDDLDIIECAMMRRGDGPVITIAGGMPVSYASFEDMARDGWRAD